MKCRVDIQSISNHQLGYLASKGGTVPSLPCGFGLRLFHGIVGLALLLAGHTLAQANDPQPSPAAQDTTPALAVDSTAPAPELPMAPPQVDVGNKAAKVDSAEIAQPTVKPQTELISNQTAPVSNPVESSPPLKSALSLHPITSLTISGFSLSYERFLHPGVSLDIPFFLGLNDKLSDQGRFFAGAGLGLRYYLSQRQSGGYVAPSVEFMNMTFFEQKRDNETTVPGGNVLITLAKVRYGYKFLWDHFTIDVGMSMGYFSTYGGSLEKPTDANVGLLVPTGQFALGIPF